MTVKIVSWNIDGKIAPWHCLSEMDADVALLQEAGEPPQDLAKPINFDSAPWHTAGWRWWRRTATANLWDRVETKWVEATSLGDEGSGLAVSRPGTLTAASVKAPGVEPQGNRILLSEHQEQVVFVPSGAFALGRHASL